MQLFDVSLNLVWLLSLAFGLGASRFVSVIGALFIPLNYSYVFTWVVMFKNPNFTRIHG